MDDVLSRRRAVRWRGAGREDTGVSLLREDRLTVILDGQRLVSLMCLPRDLDHLAVGFLHAEGFVSSAEDILEIAGCSSDDGHTRSVTRTGKPEHTPFRGQWVVGTGCGATPARAAGPGSPAPVNSDIRVRPSLLVKAMADLSSSASLYRESRGCHSAGLFDITGSLLHFAEDIGRHNAIDKVGGARLLAGDSRDLLLVTTGRMTTEICRKAVRMGCPVVASPSVASADAADMAGEAGICLVGRVRGQSMTVYTHGWRVTAGS